VRSPTRPLPRVPWMPAIASGTGESRGNAVKFTGNARGHSALVPLRMENGSLTGTFECGRTVGRLIAPENPVVGEFSMILPRRRLDHAPLRLYRLGLAIPGNLSSCDSSRLVKAHPA